MAGQVEAKVKHRARPKAVSQMQGYPEAINASMLLRGARFTTGFAGSPDESFYLSSTFWNAKTWEQDAINNYEGAGFLSFGQ